MKQPEPQIARALPLFKTLARNANAPAMMLKPIITLTTDFGLKDWFVGTMKGVILATYPQAALVDITHDVAPGDIRAGAFALAASCRFFPKGTVHVVVIDPGVGSERRAIAVETSDYFFVGPDNGVLGWAVAKTEVKAVHVLENEQYFLQNVSHTFHGRDLFAPVAAHLSCGTPISKLGPRLKDLIRIPWPRTQHLRNQVKGEVIYTDHFGNAITNIAAESIRGLKKDRLWVYFAGKRLGRIARFYESVARGTPVAVIGSTGFLEIALNGGNAAKEFGARAGDAVSLRLEGYGSP